MDKMKIVVGFAPFWPASQVANRNTRDYSMMKNRPNTVLTILHVYDDATTAN